MNSTFSLKRIGWLSKKEFYESFLPHFKIMAIVISSIVLIRFVVEYFRSMYETTSGTFNYEGVFIVFAFIYTINAFGELKQLATRADFLTLPASHAEKVFTKWLFTNVLYWIGVIVIFTLFYFFQNMIFMIWKGKALDAYELFSYQNLNGLHYLVVILSVYFFGAATFNTGAWYKTILWGIVLTLIYLGIVFLFGYMLFPELRGNTQEYGNEMNVPMELMLEEFWAVKLARFFIEYLAAPFFWLMTYLKIKEKEV
ncbi:MAG TPA: hypothetical protein VFX48_08765 [Saprospiraceae bacterium]|nr:hypothetical protein [Saprospiraceae bacterium]